MILERLDLHNVRNIDRAHLALHPRVNLLLGPNGAGKTAVLEAVHLLVRGRSFRTSSTDALVRYGEERLEVGIGCEDANRGGVRLSYVRERGRTELRQDGSLLRQATPVAALLPIQLLLPDLADLVFGGPALRRQWLDWGTFHVKHEHADVQRDYRRTLRHRNALLRQRQIGTLPAWTAQLAELGERIGAARRTYFEALMPQVGECLRQLDPALAVSFDYDLGWRQASLADALNEDLERDLRTGMTNRGPHRADVRIRVGGEVDAPAATALSRGQAKTVASALRLGQARDLLGAGQRSLFLIDDLGAELDQTHNERFYGLLHEMGCQIIATSTHGEGVAARAAGGLLPTAAGRTFHVKQGEVKCP